jgi:condensin complex subunit 2
LKDNIWRELSNDSAATAPGSHRLSQIISHVKQMYPVERAQDITPSFYFICLLHLANEKTLKIENSADLSDLTVQQDEAVCF